MSTNQIIAFLSFGCIIVKIAHIVNIIMHFL